MLPTTGSTITAAILSPRSANAFSTAAIELNGSAMVVAANACGHARGIGDAERRHAGAGLHQQRIDVAVIAAFELDGQVAAGESARHAQRAHGGFGAGVHQPHHLHRGHASARSARPVRLRARWARRSWSRFRGLRAAPRSPAAGDGPGSAAPRSRRNRYTNCRRRRRCAILRRAAMNGGVPPTPRKARTGEFTPPGIARLRAREQRFGLRRLHRLGARVFRESRDSGRSSSALPASVPFRLRSRRLFSPR